MENPIIAYEDNQIIVAVKRPGQLTQGDATGDEDLLSQIKAYVAEKYHKPGEAYIGLVHRMDRPVGGLLVFARTSKAASRLSEQVKQHTLNRQYVCVAQGDTPAQFTLKDYLKKDEQNNKVRVLPPYLKLEGKLAVLYGRTLAKREGQSLVAIQLETGRPHQIRAQMQHFGFPLFGDHRYGSALPGEQIALWGMRLSFIHPTQKEPMTFIAPVPMQKPWTNFERELRGLESVWPQIRPSVIQEEA